MAADTAIERLTCKLCRRQLPREAFHRNGARLDRRCKACKHAARVQFRDTVTSIDAARYLNSR